MSDSPPAGQRRPALDFKPLTTGEVLDVSFGTFRKQFKALFQIALVFQLMTFGAEKVYELVGYQKFPSMMKVSLANLKQPPEVLGEQLAWQASATLVLLALAMIVWQLGVASLSAPPLQSPWLQAVHPGTALTRVAENLLPLVGTLLLEVVLLGLSAAVGAVPGVMAVIVAIRLTNAFGYVLAAVGVTGGFLIALGAFLAVTLRYLLVASVVVVEKRRGWGALQRSAELMKGRRDQHFLEGPKIRASLLLLVVFLASNSLAFLFTLPRVLALYGLSGGQGLIGAALDLLSIIGQAAVAPFGLLVMTFFYLDLRARREGLDLELAIDRLGAAR